MVFALCVCVCVCVCVSVRVPKTDNFIRPTTSHFAFTWRGGLDPFWHVRLSVCVCPSGPGFLSGVFCPPPPRTYPYLLPWLRWAVWSSLELILVKFDSAMIGYERKLLELFSTVLCMIAVKSDTCTQYERFCRLVVCLGSSLAFYMFFYNLWENK